LFIEIFTRGGERSVVKGKEDGSWFKPQLDEHASSTMPTDVAAGLSVLKLLLDFRELPVSLRSSVDEEWSMITTPKAPKH
jgi:hypothetical protein